MKGRPPVPTKLKLLRGNPGKRAINKQEPKPAAGIPPCPAWFDSVARKEWRRIVPELKRLNMLTKIDAGALEACCLAYSGMVLAEQELKKEGLTYISCGEVLDEKIDEKGKRTIIYTGSLKKSPLVAISQGYMEKYKAFLSEFGLSPASRTRIKIENPKDPASDFLAFLKQG